MIPIIRNAPAGGQQTLENRVTPVILRPHLGQKPRLLLRQSVKVGLGRHIGVAETVLDGGRRADVLVEELLPRLLRDGFG